MSQSDMVRRTALLQLTELPAVYTGNHRASGVDGCLIATPGSMSNLTNADQQFLLSANGSEVSLRPMSLPSNPGLPHLGSGGGGN